jgi:hypothetical protein
LSKPKRKKKERRIYPGLFFFSERTVIGIVYLLMLEGFLMPIYEEEGPDDMLFQQDRAPSRLQKEIKGHINRKFPKKWIGRGGSITWPLSSPDLTPLDLYFLIYVVYMKKRYNGEIIYIQILTDLHILSRPG